MQTTTTCETCGETMGDIHCPYCMSPNAAAGSTIYAQGWNASNECLPRTAPEGVDAAEWLRGWDGCETTAQFNEPDGDSPQY